MVDSTNLEKDFFEENESCKSENDNCISCEKIAHQKSKIALPISIEPYTISGKIKTKCCGSPTVSINPCCDSKNICHYIITQEICIEIPIQYGSITKVGDTLVECGKMYFEDSCH